MQAKERDMAEQIIGDIVEARCVAVYDVMGLSRWVFVWQGERVYVRGAFAWEPVGEFECYELNQAAFLQRVQDWLREALAGDSKDRVKVDAACVAVLAVKSEFPHNERSEI